MNTDRLVKLAHFFLSLASGEELPPDSKDLGIVLKNLEDLETYTARKEYAENNLEHLSSGSSRIVYLTPDKTIIKLAKNDKGIAQNKAEANPNMKSKYLNETIKHAKDYSWIETHYLEKITTKDFKEMTGLDFNDFDEAISYGLRNVSGNEDKEKPENFAKVEKSDIYKSLKNIGEKFKLMPGDLGRISSWGTRNKLPVLIDAGLTSDVFEKYYESSSS